MFESAAQQLSECLQADPHAGQFLSTGRNANVEGKCQRVGMKTMMSSLRAKFSSTRARSSSMSGSRL